MSEPITSPSKERLQIPTSPDVIQTNAEATHHPAIEGAIVHHPITDAQAAAEELQNIGIDAAAAHDATPPHLVETTTITVPKPITEDPPKMSYGLFNPIRQFIFAERKAEQWSLMEHIKHLEQKEAQAKKGTHTTVPVEAPPIIPVQSTQPTGSKLIPFSPTANQTLPKAA